MDSDLRKELTRMSQLNVLEDVCFGRRTGVEENIKIKVIIPLLNLLGFDTTRDMDFEHHVANRRADIALMIDRKPKVIVETKSLDKNLEDYKVQALDYGRKKGISWIILTNGVEVRLYKSFIEGVEDKRNRPIFYTKLEHLPQVFEQLYDLIGKENIKEIDQRTVPKVEALRRAITEDELLETMRDAKLKLFYSIREQFPQRYSEDMVFKRKIDKWVKEHGINLDLTWKDSYKSNKNFRDLVKRILGEKLNKNWFEQYESDESFKEKINKTLRDNDIQVDWKDKLCAEGSYAFINRILFLRICEDRGFIPLQTGKTWVAMMKRAVFGETVKNLVRELFGVIGEKFIIYSKPLFDHITIEDLKWKKDNVLDIVERTKKFDFKKIGRDIIGAVYQRHITRETRRRLGQFYTPEPVIEHILDQIPMRPGIKILDPACGSGGFLVSAYDKVKELMIEQGYDPDEVHSHLLKEVLHGIDIDSFATQLTVMNLLLKDLENPTDAANVIESNSLKISLDQFSEKEIAEIRKSRRSMAPAIVLKESKYDVVIGNPPYVNIRKNDPLYKEEFGSYYKDILTGIINSASLFVKRGIDLLKNEGYLGFVLPKSLLRVDSFSGIRKFILDKCEIISISDIGLGFEEVGYEVITIILRKQKNKEKRYKNAMKIITSITDLQSNQFQSYDIPQSLFSKTGVFAIYLNEKLRPIVENMEENSKELGKITDIWRGLPISINSPLISSSRRNPQDEKVLRGKDIGRYEIKHHNFINLTHRMSEKYTEAGDRLKCKKIVVQNIVTSKVRCVATYDEEACLDIDTITNVKITDPDFIDKYVLAIMNSKLGTFYIRDAIFNRAILTMHMDRPYLGQLPIKVVSKAIQRKFVRKVDRILQIKRDLLKIGYDLFTSSEFITKKRQLDRLNSELDEMVYDLYNLSSDEKGVIESLIPYS